MKDSSDDSGMEISNGESTTSDESPDQISGKIEPCQDDESRGNEDKGLKNGVTKPPPRMFKLCVVNSYGTAEMEYKLKDDGAPVKLNSKKLT